jgi:hypothetical protein
MKHLISTALLSLGLLMSGCDPISEYSFAVRNGTDTTAIHLRATMSLIGPIDTIVQPGRQISLGWLEDIGSVPTPPPITDFLEGLVITSLQGDSCARDPMLDASWWVESKRLSRRFENHRHDYQFLVRDGDFQ